VIPLEALRAAPWNASVVPPATLLHLLGGGEQVDLADLLEEELERVRRLVGARRRLTPGAYSLALKAVDDAGNTSTSVRESFLVDHPVRSRVYALFHGVGRRVALTFDDCNSARAWRSILRTLARFKLEATFFCPGQQVLADPALARRTVRAGNAIGSHGWDHANFTALSFSSAERRLIDDRAVWWRLARVAPTPYFLPPYGAYDSTRPGRGQ
jgi:peptidoglycan/xylan/chitin deacetylase (PgdA/CDA1 family)